MGWFTSIRDAIQGVGSVVGNYFLPGSSMLTGQLVSKGAQEMLGSPLGQMANLGAGIAGGVNGQFSNYGKVADSIMGNFGYGGSGTAGLGFTGAGSAGAGFGGTGGGAPGFTGAGSAGAGFGGTGADGLGFNTAAGAGAFTPSGGMASAPPWQSWLSGLQKGGSNTAAGWFSPQTILQGLSGVSQMSQAASMKQLAQQAMAQSAPWAQSGGMAGAGAALTNAISGDLSQDPGFLLSQQAAARASGGSPGGPAAQAAANAAQQYRMQLISTLGGPAGVGFSPGQGAMTAVNAYGGANTATNQAMASFGAAANTATGTPGAMPPWLQAYLIKNGMVT